MNEDSMRLTQPPKVRTGMGFHASPREVFAAFVDPELTKRFWIADSTGPLEQGSTATWTMDSGAQVTVSVRELRHGERLVFDWGDQNVANTVEFVFSRWRNGGTYVEVTESGFDGNGDQLAAHAAESTGGFTIALCSLKALLEHDVELDAVADRLPVELD